MPWSSLARGGYPMVECLRIDGNGYFGGLNLEFPPGLTILMGLPGSGKSTVIESARYLLGSPVPPNWAKEWNDKLAGAFGTGTGYIRVRTAHGSVYEGYRSWGGPLRVVGPDGKECDVSLHGEAFTAEIFGQAELEFIGRDVSAQRELLDRFAQPEARRVAGDIARVHRELERVQGELGRLDREVHEHAELATELAAVEEAIAALEHVPADGEAAAAAAQASAHKRLRVHEVAWMRRAVDQGASLKARLDDLARDLALHLGGGVDADIAGGPNGDVFAALAAARSAAAGKVAEPIDGARAALEGALHALATAERALAQRHVEQDAAYEAVVARRDEDEKTAAERRRLTNRRVDIAAKAARLADLRREQAARRAEHTALLKELSALCSTRFMLRKDVAERLQGALGSDVRITVTEGGCRDDLEERLARAVQGAHMRREYLASIARHVLPEELVRAVETADVDAIVHADEMLTGKEERAQRLVRAIAASGRTLELASAAIDDLPLLQLLTPWDYQRSADLSPGQRCALLLPILLLDETNPLVLDQPEDNLGGLSTYERFVKRVRTLKARRQFIVSTHSPNVPMLGEADKVIVLGSNAGKGWVLESGPAPDLAATIERLMDGGPEAFLGRWKKYGYGK